MKEKYNVVDLFCGGGGGAIGLHRTNRVNTVFSMDFWQPAVDLYNNYFQGNKCKCLDIAKVTEEEIKNLLNGEEVDILLGSPPCQGFTYITRGVMNNNSSEESLLEREHKNHLFKYFLNIVNIIQPKIVIMENVKGMLSMKDKFGNLIFDNILKSYRDISYYLRYEIIKVQDLGLPQSRQRCIIIASKDLNLLNNFNFPEYTHGKNENVSLFKENLLPFVTIKEAIEDIESESGYYDIPLNECSEYIKTLRKKDIKEIHNCKRPNETKDKLDRIKLIKNGQSAKHIPKDHPLKTKSKFNNSYYRAFPNETSLTITNNVKTGLLHYKEDRILNVRECLRLQNFPDDYIFPDNISVTNQFQIIANAIPPLLTEKIGNEIIKVLDNYDNSL